MSMSAQTMQQSLPDSGGGIGGSLTAHPMLIAAAIGGAVGLFVLLRKGGSGASAPSSDASVGNVQIASLQDQLLRFSGEQSLRDQTTQNAITGLGSALGSQIDSARQSLSDQANMNAMGNAYTQTGLATYLGQLIQAYDGGQKTPAEHDAIVSDWRRLFGQQLAIEDARQEAGDGGQYRQWLAIRSQQGNL